MYALILQCLQCPQSGHSAAEFYSGLSSQFLLGINADLRKVACLKKRMANAISTKGCIIHKPDIFKYLVDSGFDY